MKKNKDLLIFIRSTVLALIFTTSLNGCSDYKSYWESKPYEVAWIDSPDNVKLYYQLDGGGLITKVKAKIISIGSNRHFMVAKRSDNKGEISYYYIDKHNDTAHTKNYIYGPYNEDDFTSKKEELGLPDFNVNFR